eukprot:2955024-Amphidinium_carterae.1
MVEIATEKTLISSDAVGIDRCVVTRTGYYSAMNGKVRSIRIAEPQGAQNLTSWEHFNSAVEMRAELELRGGLQDGIDAVVEARLRGHGIAGSIRSNLEAAKRIMLRCGGPLVLHMAILWRAQ